MAIRYDKEKLYNWTIYLIVSPSGRQYIGKTVNYKQRLRHYKHSQAKSQRILNKSFIKYGIDSHKIEIIDTFEGNLSCGSSKEMFWIRTYMSNSVKYPKQRGMNLTDGGEGTIGHKFTDKQLKNLSESHKGQPGYWAGKKRSQELKDKVAASLTGRKHPENRKKVIYTDDARKKVSDFMKGNTYRRGTKYSTEIIEKMNNSMIDKFGKVVLQFDLLGNLLSEFRGLGETTRITGIPKSTISNIIKYGYKKSRTGFQFKYKAA